MPGKRHSEDQILYALRQVEGGKKVSEVCREMGVSQQAVYSWKRRYAGLGLNEPRELPQLREGLPMM
jgi:putative transposase